MCDSCEERVAELPVPAPGALRQAAGHARKNGAALLDDATLLLKAKRYPRAAALAVLAEEEFAKAFLLDNAELQGRWDAPLHKALTSHGWKQSLSDGMRDVWRELSDRVAEAGWTDRYRLIARKHDPASVLPSDADLDKIAAQMKKAARKKPRDRMKQNGFYVGISRTGEVSSLPDEITAENAITCMAIATQMRDIAMQQLMAYPAVRLRHSVEDGTRVFEVSDRSPFEIP